MKKIVPLFFFFFLCSSYTEEYILFSTQKYFNSLDWAEGGTIDFSTLPSPYSIGAESVDSAFLYSDTTRDDTIFPEVEGLGLLDYSSVPYGLLDSMKSFSASIRERKLKAGSFLSSREFLPHLFAYRFENMKGVDKIDYVFFSPPTFKGAGRASSKFRFNYVREGKRKYRLMEGTFLNAKDVWTLESFDFVGWEIEDEK